MAHPHRPRRRSVLRGLAAAAALPLAHAAPVRAQAGPLTLSLRNVGSAPEDVKRFGPNTPAIARFRQRQDYGSAWIFGVRGTF